MKDPAVYSSKHRQVKIRETFVHTLLYDFSSSKYAHLKAYRYTKKELLLLFEKLTYKPLTPPYRQHADHQKRDTRNQKKLYQKLFLQEENYQQGRTYFESHRKALETAENIYGVPKAFVVSILNIESGFGRFRGDTQVLGALYQKSLATKERGQLIYFLILCKKYGWDASKVYGSSAGALGIPQFMPLSYWRYTQDGDGNGFVDLFHSHPDAIFSIAYYLAQHGWSDNPNNQRKALWRYNRDAIYVDTVLQYAKNL